MNIQQSAIGRSPKEFTTPFRQSDVIRCLILDDSQFDRYLVRRVVSNTGLSMHITDTEMIHELKDKLETFSYDLFIVDYRLITGTGLDAVRLIRDSDRNADAAIIMISGATDTDVAARAFALGCSNFLFKESLNSETMRRAISDAVDSKSTIDRHPVAAHVAREGAKHLALAALRSTAQTIPELDQVIAFLQELQRAPNRKERDKFLRQTEQIEETCVNIRTFLTDLSKHARLRPGSEGSGPENLL